jgi:PAS domain S-box-containing protein
MNEKKAIFFIALILTTLLFFFSLLSLSFFPIFVFGMILIVSFVFLFGCAGCLLAITLIASSIALNNYKIDDLSAINIVIASIVYLVLIIITSELRKVNFDLINSEQQYKEVVERANEGIVVIQKEIIKYVNPKIIDILGYENNELIESNFKEYVIGSEIKPLVNYYKKESKKEKNSSFYETILKHKSGRKIYVGLSIGNIKYKGKPAELVIIRDITQKKQVEEILYQREQEFKILVEGAPDIIARFDKENRFIYINSVAEKEFGISTSDFFWKTFQEIGFSKEISDLWEKSLKSVFNSGKEKIIYFEQETSKGWKYYYSRLLPELDKENKIRSVLSITRDITEAKEIDKIKSDFISLSSHQLRTPLSIIRWCSKALMDESLDKMNKEEKGYIDKIYSSSKKMIKLTNSFLNVAILDLGSLNVSSDIINLVDITDEVIEEFNDNLQEKKIKLVKEYKIDKFEIKADERLLKIILKGLISNAIKYSYEKGKIFIEIKNEKKNVLFKIGDNGYGIPEEKKSKIFSKFFRVENSEDAGDFGIGLDLYIIKSIMKNCEGDIWFESPNPDLKKQDQKKGDGTVFYFTLPQKGISKKIGEEKLIT